MKVAICVKRSKSADHTLEIPSRASEGAAGFDLRADILSTELGAEGFIIAPGKLKLVPTGLIFEIPSGFEGQIRPRSGLSLRYGITVLNAPGTIDSDYRGEVGVIVANLGEKDFHVEHGQRIAQIVFQRLPDVYLTETNDLTDSKRGDKWFGSSGVE